MNVNFTLFIQVANFFVAYRIIERFLFRPTLQLILKQEEETLRLASMIKRKEEAVAALDVEKKHLWNQTQEAFSRKIPPLTSQIKPIQPIDLIINQPTHAQKLAEINALKKAILPRIIA